MLCGNCIFKCELCQAAWGCVNDGIFTTLARPGPQAEVVSSAQIPGASTLKPALPKLIENTSTSGQRTSALCEMCLRHETLSQLNCKHIITVINLYTHWHIQMVIKQSL